MRQLRFRSIALVAFLTLAFASGAWARCGMARQLVHLEAAPSKCSQGQLNALEKVLRYRLQFRESLDLPLAKKVLDERKCPSADEFVAFFDAWRQLPGTGSVYTVKKYCATTPTFYLVQFPSPEKPLDDDAATRLSEDIDRLQNVIIPALESKRTEVEALLQ
jgi:hypothetical protein